MSLRKPETLPQLAEIYIETHGLSGNSAQVYRRYARLAVHCWGDKLLGKITELDIQQLAAQLAKRYSPTTQKDILRRLRTLLQFAWSMRLIDDPPRLWPKIRSPRKAPEAWTPGQIIRLVKIATRQPGWIGQVRARDWWRAWLSVAWECGLRPSQMFRLQWRHVDWRYGLLLIEARAGTKSYADQWRPVSQECLEALQIIRPARPGSDDLIFQWPDWPRSRRDFFSVFRYLCILARIPASRTHCQLTHRWRRSGITIAAIESLEAARRHAGHTRPETTLRHYVDPRLLVRQQAPAVPPLAALTKANGNGKAKQLWLLR